MAKLLTGNLPKGNLPHAQDDNVAADKFGAFSVVNVEMLANAFIRADAVESEVVGKIAYALATQQIAAVFNPALKEAYDAKRLRVLVIATLAFHGQAVFKNFPTPQLADMAAAEDWVAVSYAAGQRYLNRINDRFNMGKAAALAVLKANRAGVVATMQAGSQNVALKAFLDIARPQIADAMKAFKAAKAEKEKAAVAKVDKVKSYLDKAELSAADLANLIVHLNRLHAEAETAEDATRLAAAALASAGADEDEDEFAEAA